MSIDFTIKPVGNPVATPIIRPEPEVARTAIATELPSPQSVTAGEAGSATTALKAETSASNSVSRQVVYDQAAAEMVFVAIDQDTSQVISQYPESWQLRARAYFRELDQSKVQRSPALATDRIV